MGIQKIEIQDDQKNIYYPHTDSSVVKYKDSTAEETLDNFNTQLNACVKKTKSDITYYINSKNGNDDNNGLTNETPFKTIQHALNILPKSIQNEIKINLSAGTYDEEIIIKNFEGTGSLYIKGGSDVTQAANYNVKNIIASNCSLQGINFQGINLTSTEKEGIKASRCNYVNVQMCRCINSCAYDGISIQINSSGLVAGCVISNRLMAIKAMYNSMITSSNNSGDNNTYGLGSYFTSTIGKQDTQPQGATTEFTMSGGEIR